MKLERYKNWANYERLRAYNVEAAYCNLQTYRQEKSMTAFPPFAFSRPAFK